MVLILTYAGLNPDHFKMGDPQENRRRAKANFLEEAELVDEVGEFGHGPLYITHVSQPAGPFIPYPAGSIHYIVMTRVPGRNLNSVYQSLTDKQLESIRLQLARTLEYAPLSLPFSLFF